MTAILWILIIIAFALAFIGLIKPVIPRSEERRVGKECRL